MGFARSSCGACHLAFGRMTVQAGLCSAVTTPFAVVTIEVDVEVHNLAFELKWRQG